MIPDLALIVTCYVLYRLVETTISAFQRSRQTGTILGVLAALCGIAVCSLAYDIVNAASKTSNSSPFPQ